MSLFSEELESFEETGVAPEEPSASCQGDLTVDQCELQAAELRATNAEQRCAPGLRASPEPSGGGRMLKWSASTSSRSMSMPRSVARGSACADSAAGNLRDLGQGWEQGGAAKAVLGVIQRGD